MEKNKYSGESNRASKVAVSGSCMRRNSKRGNTTKMMSDINFVHNPKEKSFAQSLNS